MNAADVMTLDPLSVAPQTALVEAARLMLQHRISGLPVTDAKGAVAGVLTEGDLLRRGDRHGTASYGLVGTSHGAGATRR